MLVFSLLVATLVELKGRKIHVVLVGVILMVLGLSLNILESNCPVKTDIGDS